MSPCNRNKNVLINEQHGYVCAARMGVVGATLSSLCTQYIECSVCCTTKLGSMALALGSVCMRASAAYLLKVHEIAGCWPPHVRYSMTGSVFGLEMENRTPGSSALRDGRVMNCRFANECQHLGQN
jgi:hypothetical protein